MEELIKTNDPILISFVEALLSEASIEYVVVDGNMSVLEGSIGVLPRRILVPVQFVTPACNVLQEAGIEVSRDGR